MSGAATRRSLGSGAMPYRLLHTFTGVSCRPSFTPSCRRRSRLQTHNNKAADPGEESATAATGQPPEPHEREAVIVARPGSFGHRAHRMARYKVIRHAGPHARCAALFSERDARLRHAEGSGVPYAMSDWTRDAASQSARTVRGRPRLKQRVQESHKGDAPPIDRWGPVRAGGRDSGRLAARRTRPIGRRLSAPTRDFGPTARLRKGPLMMAMPHRREAIWRELDDPTSARPPASARSSIASSS